LAELHLQGARAVIQGAARERGYRVDVGSLPRRNAGDHDVRVLVDATGVSETPVAQFRGFSASVPLLTPVMHSAEAGLDAVAAFFDGQAPQEVVLHEPGPARAALLRQSDGVRVLDAVAYPERV
jgi:hypothetical protein